MKASDIYVSVENRSFVQYFTFEQEDGLPENYTLVLCHMDKPLDPPEGTVYKNGDWGCWDSPTESLVSNYCEKSDSRSVNVSVTVDESRSFSWIDIYDGIILYSSTGGRYENFVLYDVKTGMKKTITTDCYIRADEWDTESFDHFREPTLLIQDNIIYVKFEAVDGWYDGGENVGEKLMCFKRDTLEQLKPEDCPLNVYEVEEAIDEIRGEEFTFSNGTSKFADGNINLYPGTSNKFGIETLSSRCHDTLYGRRKHKDFSKSLIKWMRKIRLEYAKSIGAEIRSYNGKTHIGKDFWEHVAAFARKVENWANKNHYKKFDRRRKRGEKKRNKKVKKTK